MLITPGPRRLILMRAGNFEYAEIVLGSSTLLVGPNNVGKTSLISTLNFLYIPSFNEMRFGDHHWEETRRYYFGSDASTVIFEVATASGNFVTVGLRGRGQVGNFHVERFAFVGSYRSEDFMSEDGRLRPFAEVKARLSDRDFRLLEPNELRAALVGDFSVPALNMGIVPLQNPSRYSDFAFLLKNLLRLKHLSQDDVKGTLLNTYRHEIPTAEIDLYREYADLLSTLTAERAKLANLRKVGEMAGSLKNERNKRDNARRNLPALYATLVATKAREQNDLETAKANDQKRLQALEAEDENERQEMLRLEAENTQIVRELTRVGDWISAFATETLALRDYLPKLAEQQAASLAEEIDVLTGKIVNAGDPTVIERQLIEAQRKLLLTTQQRDKHASLVGTRLLERLGHEAITDLARIFNPAILRLPVEPGVVEIADEALLVATLKAVHGHVDIGQLQAAGATIFLDQLPDSGGAAVVDIATLNAEIESLQQRVAKIADDLEAARNMAALKSRRSDLQKELDAAKAKARRYADWTANAELEPGKKKELAGVTQRQTDNATSRHKITEAAKKRVELRSALQSANNGYRERQHALDGMRPTPPDPAWPVGVPDPEWQDCDAKQLHSQYAALFVRYTEAEAKMLQILGNAEVVTQDGFEGSTPDQRIDAMIEAIDSLPEHDRSFHRLLGDVVNGMRASFNNMCHGFDGLRGCIDRFNREIAGVAVSNLSKMTLEVYENTETTRHYRQLAARGDLLEDPAKTDEAIRMIDQTIKATRVLRLSDWFGVRFSIVTDRGETKRYDDISTIESNGTTLTIKILFNIVLIRAMMRKNKAFMLPFFFDEAHQIDAANLHAILSMAEKNGFCPVMASTLPSPSASNIDFVQRIGGRTFIDPKRRIERRTKSPEAEFANAS
ncbi:hypothetical protein [Rhodocyclus purpureus]|uniref:hypothetical protein n=1 Tax=Rhodocyclus purpureus TaxID=1067 RepID=UPI0019126391|nr:hypothetical protein [Rhodocyclus purpureus]MBK5915716.1 hypothetical protein [Rhodocyclus purpureus]